MRDRRNIARARTLRHARTDAEHHLWQYLRGRRLNAMKFRRQHPVGGYFADFYCAELGLVVEIDGSQHMDNLGDEIRTRALEARGLRVLRFWNDDVLLRTVEVLEAIVAASTSGS